MACMAVDLILPMALETKKALTWDMVCFAMPSSQIEMVWLSNGVLSRRGTASFSFGSHSSYRISTRR